VEGLIATGYLRLGPEANMNNEQTRMDELDGILATTGGHAWHDDRLRTLSQSQVRSDSAERLLPMQAVFFSRLMRGKPIVAPAEEAKYKAAIAAYKGELKPLETELARVEAPYRKQIRERKISELPDYVRTALDTPADSAPEGQRLNALQVERHSESASAKRIGHA